MLKRRREVADGKAEAEMKQDTRSGRKKRGRKAGRQGSRTAPCKQCRTLTKRRARSREGAARDCAHAREWSSSCQGPGWSPGTPGKAIANLKGRSWMDASRALKQGTWCGRVRGEGFGSLYNGDFDMGSSSYERRYTPAPRRSVCASSHARLAQKAHQQQVQQPSCSRKCNSCDAAESATAVMLQKVQQPLHSRTYNSLNAAESATAVMRQKVQQP
eukprot:366355-Chlamydomonas_euryale.AAC.14